MQITGATLTGISKIQKTGVDSYTFIADEFYRYSPIPGPTALEYDGVSVGVRLGGRGYFADTATFNGGGTLYRDIFGFAPGMSDVGGGQHISLTCYYSMFYMANPSTDTITTTAHGTLSMRFTSGSGGAWSVANNREENYNPSESLGVGEFSGVILNTRPLIRMRSFADGTASAGTLTKIAFYGIIHQEY